MEKEASGKMNKKAREFKPKDKPASTAPMGMLPSGPPVSESKFFKGVLPGQGISNPPPRTLPPGMDIKYENGKLVFSEGMPAGLQAMFVQAYDEGKLDDWVMSQMDQEARPKRSLDEEYALSPEEEALADEFFQEQNAIEMCPFYLEGTWKYGKKCQNFHPSAIDEFAGDVDFEGDRECGICMDYTLAKDRQFGLLDGCEHAFCLECIRNWRATYIRKMSKHAMRMCPLCRKTSYTVIPSSVYLAGGDAKEQLIEDYRDVLSEIPCRHFNYGKGECPFLNSCFYAHYTKDGEKFDYSIKAKYLNEDGEIVTEKEDERATLADLIGL